MKLLINETCANAFEFDESDTLGDKVIKFENWLNVTNRRAWDEKKITIKSNKCEWYNETCKIRKAQYLLAKYANNKK